MKAKPQSFKSYFKLVFILTLYLTYGLSTSTAQCPTVVNSLQSFCDVESILVGDLEAIDNGGGIVWYETATSTTPLLNSQSLVSGEDYYADDNTGTCGTRQRVDVVIYGPPTGQNFQGVCLDDPTLATVADLVAVGNDVQWYLTPSGGLPLPDTTVLTDNTLYYADQLNPDTGCRTSRLTVLVNVGFTPIPTGDPIQYFCSSSGNTPTVGDLVASGTNNWYISLFSALPLPTTTALVNGQTYYATTLDPPCESIGRLGVLVLLETGPDPGIDGILDLCDADTNTPVDLFTLLGGSPDSGGTWSPALASGTGVFDPNVDPDGVYTYTVLSNNTCPNESSTITITTYEQPTAGTDSSVELCSTDTSIDLFENLGGNPEVGGTWSPTLASGTGIFDPSVDAPGLYTYTVSATPPCTDATATVNVTVTPFNDAGEDGSIIICDSDGTIDLFNSLNGTPDTGGTWSPTLASGTGIFDPLVDSAGTYTYSFTGSGSCPDSSATVTVTVNNLPDTGIDNILELCSNDNSSVDLFSSLGGSPDTGGTWSPALASGTGVFDPTIDSPGIYTYSIAGTSPCPDASSTVEVLIIQEPNAGLDGTLNICDDNGLVDLFNSLGGTPDSGGTWSPALASGTGVFDPNIDPDVVYTYTVTGTSPCPDATATVTITVTPFMEAGENGAITLCTTDAPVDLFNSLGGTPDSGGTWSPALASGTGIFNPNVDSAGTYTYTTSPGGTCDDDSAIVIVTIETPPNAGNNSTVNLCSLDNTIDLFNNLGGTPDVGGAWSPTLASGTGVFDPNIDPEGTYTYTLTSAVCGDVSATVTVTVNDANNAGSNGVAELCENDPPIDLFNSLNDTPDTGGTWSPALASGTGVFDPSIDSAGTYTYTVSNSASLCPDDSATVIVSVLLEPNAGNDSTLNLCNSSNIVDLFNSLAGTPDSGGTWSPVLASGTGVFDPNVDPEGIYTYTVTNSCGTSSANVTVSLTDENDAGENATLDICENDPTIDLFTVLGGTPQVGGSWSPSLNSGTGLFDPSIDSDGVYTYTVSNIATLCPDDSATVAVTILTEPNAGGDGTLNLCGATDPVDLFNSLTGTPETGGTWSPALISGTGVFDPNNDSEGIYTYTVTNSCGSSSASVTVSNTNVNDAGENGTVELCANDLPVNLFDSLGGTPQVGGTWSPALASGTGVFDPNLDTAGTYTYTISSSTSLCPDDSATVTVNITSLPDAGGDATLNLCNATNTVDLFNSLTGSPQSGGTWSPALTSGTGIFDPNIDPVGTYTYTVSNSCGTSSATVTVSLSNLNDAGDDASINLCEDDTTIDLFTVLGGTPQVGGTWSPTLSSGTGIFDPSIDTAGTYTYTVSGGSSSLCPDDSANVTVTIGQTVDAGNDSAIFFCTGDVSTIDLFDILLGTPDTGGTWSPTLTSGTGVFDPTTDLAGIYTYTVTSSCGDSSATVTVGFSNPNDAGNNSTLELCNNDMPVDLFNSLGGTPQTGGTWSPTLTSGIGIFDPSVDTSGVYTYTVFNPSSTCPPASAQIAVTVLPAPNAGVDAVVDICIDDTNPVDLFDSLGPLAETGGTWSPALASGTGVFDPTIDTPGNYTYTVTSSQCNLTASATVTVNINDIPDASGLRMSSLDRICLGESLEVNIVGATQLADGDYTIVYEITDSNSAINSVTITITNGEGSFIVPSNLIPNAGPNDLAILQLFIAGQNCSADTQNIESLKFLIIDPPTPQIISGGSEFCLDENPTIANLSTNIIDDEIIVWYNAPVNGDIYDSSTLLVDGETYYASILTIEGCESQTRLAVTVSLISCIGDLLIPDGFSPNNDNVNDVFDILYLEDLYPNFKLTIFNRYGNLIYEGNINTPKWDGTSKNNSKPLPAGVYFYILEFNDGEKEAVQGRVYLNR